MPIKRTIYRTKFAIKALIISSIILLVPLVLSLVIQPVNIPYLIFSIVMLVVNAGLDMYFTFVARKNKLSYILSVVGVFLIVALLAVLGYLLKDASEGFLLQYAWGVGSLVLIYLITEAFPGPSIYMRIWGPIIPVAFSALYFLFLLVPGPYDSLATTIYNRTSSATYPFILVGLFLFIFFLCALIRKKPYETLGDAKLIYDEATVDEIDLEDRKTATKFTKIPRLYEGGIYALSDDTVYAIANSINAYLNDCIDTINDMLDFAKGAIKTVEEYNDFVDDYNRWIKNLNTDRKEMADFLERMAKDRWLDLDDGRRIIYDFCNYKVEAEDIDDKTTFYISVGGFSRTYSHNNGIFAGGKLSRTMSYSAPKLNIIKVGYHSAEKDSQREEHGYHPPGTPMPEED